MISWTYMNQNNIMNIYSKLDQNLFGSRSIKNKWVIDSNINRHFTASASTVHTLSTTYNKPIHETEQTNRTTVWCEF